MDMEKDQWVRVKNLDRGKDITVSLLSDRCKKLRKIGSLNRLWRPVNESNNKFWWVGRNGNWENATIYHLDELDLEDPQPDPTTKIIGDPFEK